MRSSLVVPFIVPLICLSGLAGCSAAVLVHDQFQLTADAEDISAVAKPVQEVVSRLQDERRFTAVWQANRTGSARADLDTARKRTDAAIAEFHRRTSMPDASVLGRRVKTLNSSLSSLTVHRNAIDARSRSASSSFAYFTADVSHGLALISEALRINDADLGRGGTATVALAQSTEMLAREDALLSGSLSSRRISAANRARFSQYLAAQEASRAYLTARDLPGSAAAQYGRITTGSQWTTVGSVEQAVSSGRGADLPKQAAAWTTASDSVVSGLRTLTASSMDVLADRADDRADELMLAALVTTVATLTVVAGAAVLALRVRRARRSTLGLVTELTEETEQWATRRLPELLKRIQRGERVDPNELVPLMPHARDELGQLASAIDQLVHAAAQSTMQQSQGRQGADKIVAQLIRRAHTLIHRMISRLDDLERNTEDSDQLKEIFHIDHLATRVRRHAENLIILSGTHLKARPDHEAINDVMRGAVAETEKYPRVQVNNTPHDRRLALVSRAVGDVTHLLAELIENGTNFSPPHTNVTVRAIKVGTGLAIEIEDQGLGIDPNDRDRANERLAKPAQIDMTALGEDPRLGHFVVARLAERHGIKVNLCASVYGGTLAVVVLPEHLLVDNPSPVLDQLQLAAVAAGRTVGSPAENPSLTSTDAQTYSGREAPTGVSGGARMPVDVITHSIAGGSGFPDYRGEGLLAPDAINPVSPTPRSAEQTRGKTDASSVRAGSRAGSAEQAPAAYTDHSHGGGPGLPRRNPAESAAPSRSVPAPDPSADVPEKLPKRVRGTSLARELRREETERRSADVRTHRSSISPDEAARAMRGLQRGLRQATEPQGNVPHGTRGWQDESADPSANER
ncbi:nitrate- and nitrite sensing domain-containing protein [Streptomyces sp. NPDC101455]|uniref:sensor histidine kinase n=1 Tax=Streptomyces sp. NPDC101455 TaxID=3366142 RepID=UPI003820995F